MKKKKTINHLIRWGIVLFMISLSVFIIGCHSDYLVTALLKWGCLGFCAILTGWLFYLTTMRVNCIKGKLKGKAVAAWNVFFNIFTGLFCAIAVFCLVLFYGPDNTFRDWLITTAENTMHHKYICEIFYGEDEIAETLARNTIIEPEGDTNPDLIQIPEEDTSTEEETTTEEEVVYANEYEKAILEHEPDQDYKIIRFTVNDQNAYLAAVYDASKVHLTVSKDHPDRGEYVTKMSERLGAMLAINGGGFKDANHNSTGGVPLGVTISDGKVITDYSYSSGRGIIGFNQDNVLVLLKKKNAKKALDLGVRDCVTMGPFLIVNGEAAFTKGNGGWGYAARTAIGQRADGIVLFLVVDSNETRSKGASMVDLTEIMQQYGAVNAANLDGGTSAVMVENGKLISDPIDSLLRHRTRPIADAFLVY